MTADEPGAGKPREGDWDAPSLYPPWEGSGQSLRVWALEPYLGGSHRQFLEGLTRHCRHEIRVLGLPGRHWKWRMHGGGLRLAEMAADLLEAGEEPPQVLLASSMLDVPGFLALAPDSVSRAPLLLYMHENQLTYPLPEGVERDLTYGVRQMAAAAAADRLLFNSRFHRDEFVAACRALLDEVPDEAPRRTVESIAARAGVLPLGIDLRRLDEHRPPAESRGGAESPLVLWNQRWEYDKAPGAFFRALYELLDDGVEFRVAVAGPNRGVPTAEFAEARRRLEGRVVQWGMVEDAAAYARLLWEADVVVSTALHDFFGVAVAEAIYCGCRPVLPDRLSYPELIPEEVHPEVLYGGEGPVPLLRRALGGEGSPWSTEWQRTWMAPYDWGVMGPRYDREVWACRQTGKLRPFLPGLASE